MEPAESVNPRYGRTRNPLDLSRVAGGSSGGEGALVGSGSSVFGVGSDILGSIRIPAAFCGVVGFKPHSGAVDQAGTWPVVTGNTKSWLGLGPLTRSVRDARLVYDVIAAQPVAATPPGAGRLVMPGGFPLAMREPCMAAALAAARTALPRVSTAGAASCHKNHRGRALFTVGRTAAPTGEKGDDRRRPAALDADCAADETARRRQGKSDCGAVRRGQVALPGAAG